MESETAFRTDLYRGTAPFYDRFRPAYPSELFDDLCERLPVSGSGKLLDLACGTGQIAVPLARRFARVVAVDQESESVAFGRAKAEAAGVDNIQWIAGAAETVELEPGFELVAVGSAFHRLHRLAVAKRIHSWLRPGGGVALLWSDTPPHGDAAWQQALTKLITTWLERLGSSDRIPPGWDDAIERDPHEAVLARAGFEYLGRFEFRRAVRWTAETLAGFMYSTSFLNRDVLGERTEEFETDLALLVSSQSSTGVVVADAAFAYQLARKQG